MYIINKMEVCPVTSVILILQFLLNLWRGERRHFQYFGQWLLIKEKLPISFLKNVITFTNSWDHHANKPPHHNLTYQTNRFGTPGKGDMIQLIHANFPSFPSMKFDLKISFIFLCKLRMNEVTLNEAGILSPSLATCVSIDESFNR